MIFNAFERMVAMRYLRARRQEGFISVTPLHLDLTNYRLLSAVQEWGLQP